MSDVFRFAVIGDTHFCWEKHHDFSSGRVPLGDVPDCRRYTAMRDTVGAVLLDRIGALQPELLVSTGDYVEGGLNDHPAAAREELLDGWEIFGRACTPVLIAKGTHEGVFGSPGGEAFRRDIVPRMAAGVGGDFRHEYYRIDRHGCAFLILDYLQYELGGEQERWLIAELEQASRTARRIFLFAHPPLYLWGRHAFDNCHFVALLEPLCRRYPVDIWFCGHTHNQTVSFHRRGSGGDGFLQLTGSAVGYPAMAPMSLDTFHQIADYGPDHQYLWGIFEDSAPGFFLIEVDGDTTRVNWHGLGGGTAGLEVPRRWSCPVGVTCPAMVPPDRCWDDRDRYQIRGAWLNIFSVVRGDYQSEVRLNGMVLGAIPGNVSYAARRYLAVPEAAWDGIGRENRVEIVLPDTDGVAVGSLSLEVLLYDGRLLRSQVAPEILVIGSGWQDYRRPERFIQVKPGQQTTVRLQFN